MKKIVALVQARIGSSRFKGKMLARLGEHPVIEWVLCRTGQSKLVDEVILATTAEPHDDPLAKIGYNHGLVVYRGSEVDVLGRLAGAAYAAQASTVIRICADNPFIDPGEIDRLVEYYLSNNCDYACNHQDRLGSSYADGFGAEIMSNTLLQELSSVSNVPRHREHVTLYLWENLDSYSVKAIPAPQKLAFPSLRFDVDAPNDLDYLQHLVANGVKIESTAEEIIKIAIKCYSTYNLTHYPMQLT